MKWYEKVLCLYLGWHKPKVDIEIAGINLVSKCKRCGKRVMLDSQGNWFE